MSNPTPHLLSDSPSLRDVAGAFRKFVSCHGPAEIYYSGKVYDRSEDETHHFRGCIAVERVLPQQEQFLVSLLDGFFSWIVAPVEPYNFEIVAKGTSPSDRKYFIDADALWPEWAADFRPYVDARKLTSVDAMLKLLGFRNPVDAPAVGSIAPEFRSQRRRCGIYVLHFANGEYYVGQTVDITRRFVQHRKRHGDIARVSFRSIGRRSLDFHEEQLIRLLESCGFHLRNIDMTSILSTEPGSFDEIMDAEQQQRWLSDMSFVDLSGQRSEPLKRDQLYSERYQEFTRLECYDDVFDVVKTYIRNGIPAILRGEASYWQASVLPANYTVLTRININWQEVFFVNLDEQGPYFYLLVSKRGLQRVFGDDLAGLGHHNPDLEWEDALYRAGGSDQVSILIGDVATARRFFGDPAVLPAIRHFNLRLMKRGKCPWARNHNFELMNAIVGADQAA
jgi:hypothetical protein